MSNIARMMQRATAGAGGAGLDITDVFSTYLYAGTSAEHTITNGIDLAGEGGMIWGKIRSSTDQHWIVDSERGTGSNSNYKYVMPNLTTAELDFANRSVSSFNSNGFTLQNGTDKQFNESGYNYASWTFRKAPKFLDVVKYQGNNESAQYVNHNLGVTPGCIILKALDEAGKWYVWHRGLSSASHSLRLNTTAAESVDTNYEIGINASDTQFYVDTGSEINYSTSNYIAYLFAHNDGDGEFGPDSDQDIIKCGSFTGSSSSDVTVDVGFEPQWLLTRRTGGGNWTIIDNMRGAVTGGIDNTLFADSSSAENTGADRIALTATGFIQKSGQTGNETVIYIAIRRGPLAQPESGTEVFHTQSQSNGDTYSVGFPTDLALINKRSGSSINTLTTSRLAGNDQYLVTSGTNAEATSSNIVTFDLQDSFDQGFSTASPWVGYHWKRSPGYFDVVTYTGNDTARTIQHNLGVVPEMIWVKKRSGSSNWSVLHSGLNTAGNEYIRLDLPNAKDSNVQIWNGTVPTDTVFSIGASDQVNHSYQSATYIAYLFATVPGVSKVGSVSHTVNSATNVDCGFTSGARFVLLKVTDSSGSWFVYDTARGIVAGNDARLKLDSTAAENTGSDDIDPLSSGFTITSTVSTGSYIFYAIA